MEDEQKNAIITSIKKRFAFLLDNQYNMGSMNITGTMGRWEIELESDYTDVIYKFESDRDQIFLKIANREEKFWVSLQAVVFFITNEVILFWGADGEYLDDLDRQINNQATVLKDYIEKINFFFERKSKSYKNKFLASGKKLIAIQIKEIERKSQISLNNCAKK